MDDLGLAVQNARRHHGWDQAELVRRLGGVTQQTVSKWERGLSRPNPKMLQRLESLLGINLVGSPHSATDRSKTERRLAYVAPPVRPLNPTLPLDKLTEETFEDFSADLARCLYPEAAVHRYGSRGHKQEGVDVVAKRSDGGTAAVFQCKRHKQFGPAMVVAAVKAVTLNAERYYLLLARTASPAARLEVSKHPNWILLDAEDMSRIVRSELDPDQRIRIVDTYFPGWRQDFLGIDSPSPWLTIEQQLGQFSSERLLNFDQPLVGRADMLEAAGQFLAASAEPVALLVGRGGIGKTRLLYAISAAAGAGKYSVRFLLESVPAEHYETLPVGNLLVVIDNAQDRDDIIEVVATVRRHRPTAKFLLALRPQGLGPLQSRLQAVGLHPTDYPVWTIGDLSLKDSSALAASVLGDGFDEWVARELGRIAQDCPLLAVIGGGLIRRGQLSPTSLETSPKIRDEILRGFRDALVPLSDGDSHLRRDLIDAVSLLQPLDTSDPATRQTIEALIGRPYDRVIPTLRSLEDAGVVLRRGATVRIVPDLLGDVVLREACFDEQSGVSTGFVERVFGIVDGPSAQHVFTNASRADWQVRTESRSQRSIVDSLWGEVDSQFRRADLRGRIAILRLVEKIAFFQPERAIAMVKWALEHPTEYLAPVDDVLARIYPPSVLGVRHAAAAVLKNVAYNLNHLVEAADLLWELARDDDRPTNQYPDHPVRILTELASIGTNKPLDYSTILIERASEWLEADLPSRFSPLSIVEPVVATEGTDHVSDAMSITIKPFIVLATAVGEPRSAVLDLAFAEMRCLDLRRAIRGVETICASLRYPHGYLGVSPSLEALAPWTPLFIATIQRLADVLRDTELDPTVRLKAVEAVDWHADHSPTETKSEALKLLSAQRSTVEDELALLLLGPWNARVSDGTSPAAKGQSKYVGFAQYLKDHRTKGSESDYQGNQERLQARCEAFAKVLQENFSEAEAADLIRERLTAAAAAEGGRHSTPGYFLWTLVGIWPKFGSEIVRQVAVCESSPLVAVVPPVLSRLCDVDPALAMMAAASLMGGSDDLTIAVASAFGWNRGGRGQLLPGEWDLLVGLSGHPNVFVRRCVVHAAQVIGTTDPARGLELLVRVPFAASQDLADDFFSSFSGPSSLSWSHVSDEDQARLLAELRDCPSIENYHLTEFVGKLAAVNPRAALGLLADRVERAEKEDPRLDAYRAIPFRCSIPTIAAAERDPILWSICEWMSKGGKSWRRGMDGASIFAAFAGNFDRSALDVLERFVSGAPKEHVEVVAHILRGGKNVPFDDVGFVTRMLRIANKHGAEHMQYVASSLHAAVSSGVKSGAIGQPFAEDVEQGRRAAEVARTLPVGSLEARFYQSLADAAARNIEWHTDHDQKMLDGREWS